ncbi:MAG: hypothetical protein LH606_08350, partial [Cytophagaceae bacterium]|nr:hypothetical protein [Cytophagaceae bacterium]
MSLQEARQRIKQCQSEKSVHLDLAGLNLEKLPEEIEELTSLQRLNVSGTQISDLTPLAGLTSLQDLSVWQTQV